MLKNLSLMFYVPHQGDYLLNHSHKKRKDSLETRAERVVLCAYVENHAILEPIHLYRASKCKLTKRPGC